MTATMASTLIEEWISSVLLADSTITATVATRVYTYAAPASTTYPLIVLAPLSGVDSTPPGGLRFVTTMRYAVKAVDQTQSVAALTALAARIDTLLQNQQYVAVSGGIIAACIRTNLLPLGPLSEGKSYRQIVQTYSIQVQGG